MRQAAIVAAGAGILPAIPLKYPGKRGTGRKRLIVILFRGGADGLSLVVPSGDPLYYRERPSIAIPAPLVLDLDGYFGLHPALAGLKPLWDSQQLAIIPAVGLPARIGSHADAQDAVESGTPGVKTTPDGWVNRACCAADERLRAVAIGRALPRMLSGEGAATVCEPQSDNLAKARGSQQSPVDRFDRCLRVAAALICDDLGPDIVFVEMGGWDHHIHQGSIYGRFADLARQFGQALAAFWADVGAAAANTVLVTVSEFGRSIAENSRGGTDHGWAGAMFVLGGPVRGGKFYGQWPGLNGRFGLNVTVDFRAVLSEILRSHVGLRDLAAIFPAFHSREPLGLIGPAGRCSIASKRSG